jgi:predicted XRE-type DNA-binding protein
MWIDIINFTNKYEISNIGEIRNKKTGRILRPSKDGSGYLRVGLCKNGKKKYFSVHRLVLESFLGPCPFDMESCHNDGDMYNNNIKNLRFDTHRNNNRDKIKHGTIYRPEYNIEKLPNVKTNKNQVIEIKKLLAEGKLTQKEISEKLGVTLKIINDINTGRTWERITI